MIAQPDSVAAAGFPRAHRRVTGRRLVEADVVDRRAGGEAGVGEIVRSQAGEPHLLERSIAYTFKGTVTAECPEDAKFPVGGTIVCRLTERGAAAKDATILRTTPSGWKIVALDPPKK